MFSGGIEVEHWLKMGWFFFHNGAACGPIKLLAVIHQYGSISYRAGESEKAPAPFTSFLNYYYYHFLLYCHGLIAN